MKSRRRKPRDTLFVTGRTWALIALLMCSVMLDACSPASTEKPAMTFLPPLVIAHRGARSLAPENTLAAGRKALEVGADMWELDVTATVDGELVVMHDDTLDRTCNAQEIFPERMPWRVEEFTLAEIQTLDCGSWFNATDPFEQIKAGNVSEADQKSYVGEPAPSLWQALEFTRDNQWRVNVELKEQPSQELGRLIVEKSVALIQELGMDEGDQVVISSFEHNYLKTLRALNPRIPIQALTTKPIPDLPAYLAELGTDVCNPKVGAWTPQELVELGQSGIRFNVWTVNDEPTMRSLIVAGVQGIITDYPQTLIAVLESPQQ
jgi:glycerophosphoryl diester phosphodiesterase